MKVKDLNIQVFDVWCLLSRVEFATLVDELAAGGAPHGEGSHQAHCLDTRTSVLGSLVANDISRVPVGREVFL